MMSKTKKIFGIGAVMIMILVAFSPALNGSLLDKKVDKNLKITTSGGKYDLRVEILEEPRATNENPTADKEGNEYAIYVVNYRIYNQKNEDFAGNPLTAVFPEEDPSHEIDSWYELEFDDKGNVIPMVIKENQYVDREHKIEVKCNIQDEKYFYDKNVYLECGVSGGQEATPLDNVDFERSWKFWNDNMPTKGQLIGFGEFSRKTTINTNLNGETYSLPIPKFMQNDKYFPGGFSKLKDRVINNLHAFENFPHFNKSKLGLGDNNHIYEVFDVTDDYQILQNSEGANIVEEIWELLESCVDYVFETLPTSWNNHRFGWLREMTLYRSRVLVDLIAFGMFCAKFYEDGKEQFNNLAEWLVDLIEIIVISITTFSFPVAKFTELIGKIPIVISDVVELIGIFFENGYSVLLYAIFEKLCLDLEKMKIYRGQKPWEEDITLMLTVCQLDDDEDVTFECRGVEGDIDYNCQQKTIPLPSEWMSGDFPLNPKDETDGYQGAHLCQITIEGSEHKTIKTKKFASYCYSGGEIHRIVNLDDEEPPGGGKSKNMDEPTEKSQDIFSKNLIFKLLHHFSFLKGIFDFQWLKKDSFALQSSI